MKKEMVGNVPGNILGMFADLAHKLQHGVITGNQLGRFLQKQNPFDSILGSVHGQLVSWRLFYRNKFGFELGEVVIPEPRPGFDRLIVVAKGITVQRVYDQCQKHFKCWKYTVQSLDEEGIVHDDRPFTNRAYAVLIRGRVEADEEFKNLSADQLKKKNHQGITLTERLLYGLKYFTETGKHLDIKNITSCTGSRYDHGDVPGVGWPSAYRGVYVLWYNPGRVDAHLRSREIVSQPL